PRGIFLRRPWLTSEADRFRLHPSMRKKPWAAPEFRIHFGKWPSRFDAEAEFAAEPGTGIDPVAIGTAGRNPQDRGGWVPRQAGTVAQLDQLGLECVLFRQAGKCRVEREQVQVRLRGNQGVGIQIAALSVAAMLATLFAASIVDQDAAHRLGG